MLNEISTRRETLEIRTEKQTYFKPFILAEALMLKKEYPEATLISGSTDVALRQTKKRYLSLRPLTN